jgi:hypothetical protein
MVGTDRKVKQMDLNQFEWVDANGDGYNEVGVLDVDGNGLYDYAAADSNSDGYVEMYGYEVDGDGVFDSFQVDTDLDGYVDSTFPATSSGGTWPTADRGISFVIYGHTPQLAEPWNLALVEDWERMAAQGGAVSPIYATPESYRYDSTYVHSDGDGVPDRFDSAPTTYGDGS